jgi:hypothetical protein
MRPGIMSLAGAGCADRSWDVTASHMSLIQYGFHLLAACITLGHRFT